MELGVLSVIPHYRWLLTELQGPLFGQGSVIVPRFP